MEEFSGGPSFGLSGAPSVAEAELCDGAVEESAVDFIAGYGEHATDVAQVFFAAALVVETEFVEDHGFRNCKPQFSPADLQGATTGKPFRFAG